MTSRALPTALAGLLAACATTAPPPRAASAEDASSPGEGSEDARAEGGPAPAERAAPEAAIEAILDRERCPACARERDACERLGGDDCGARHGRCRRRCLALARTDATPGAACDDATPCAAGLCCVDGRCVRNALLYFPLVPESSQPGPLDAEPVRGAVLRCPLTPPGPSAAVARGLNRARGAFRRCFARAPERPGACLCDAVCRLRFEPRDGPIRLRYPFADVDGLDVTIGPDGRVNRCRYSRLGAPEQTFERACSAEDVRGPPGGARTPPPASER